MPAKKKNGKTTAKRPVTTSSKPKTSAPKPKPTPAPPEAAAPPPPEEVVAADEELGQLEEDGKFYCPGCGRRTDDEGSYCGGSAESPHAPIQVVSVSELKKDEKHHTAAPNTGEV